MSASNEMTVLGHRIREVRSSRGWSLQEFALAARVGAPALAAVERGDDTALLSTLFAAADALGVAVSELFSVGEGTADAAHAASGESLADPEPESRNFRSLGEPPADYVPLEMPALWQPEHAAFAPEPIPVTLAEPATARTPEPAPASIAEDVPVPEPAAPLSEPVALTQAVLVETLATLINSATQTPLPAPAPAPAVPTRVPRTFADLRTGALEGRTFDSLPQFAVAAVVEGNYSVSAIARVFRVPGWKLQAWVDEHLAAPARPQVVAPRRAR